jgi:chromate transporter
MDILLQRDLFIAFFRSGMLGYGGGPSTIPLVHKEVVERFGWMNDQEFADVLALGNALPGPIATKMAGYIGYKVGGWVGLINGLIATVLPTVLLMIGLIGLLSSFRESRVVAGMTAAVAPVVGVMLFVLTMQFLKQSKKGIGLAVTVVLSIVSLAAYQFLGIHPAIVIGFLIVYGLAVRPKREKEGAAS